MIPAADVIKILAIQNDKSTRTAKKQSEEFLTGLEEEIRKLIDPGYKPREGDRCRFEKGRFRIPIDNMADQAVTMVIEELGKAGYKNAEKKYFQAFGEGETGYDYVQFELPQ